MHYYANMFTGMQYIYIYIEINTKDRYDEQSDLLENRYDIPPPWYHTVPM